MIMLNIQTMLCLFLDKAIQIIIIQDIPLQVTGIPMILNIEIMNQMQIILELDLMEVHGQMCWQLTPILEILAQQH